MIEVYKIVHSLYDPINTQSLLTLVPEDPPHTRTNTLKLTKRRPNHNKYAHFFTNRVINVWNGLPSDIVNGPSINSFKNKFDIEVPWVSDHKLENGQNEYLYRNISDTK